MLSAVFKFPLPEISTSPILKDLIRSFEISSSRPLFPPPPWDSDKVLEYLSGPPFEPLAKASFLGQNQEGLVPSRHGYCQMGFGTPGPVILCVIPG